MSCTLSMIQLNSGLDVHFNIKFDYRSVAKGDDMNSEASTVPKSILLSRPDRLGDVVISTSCIRAVRDKFPSAKIYFLVQSKYSLLVEDHPDLDGCVHLLDHDNEAELERILSDLDLDVVVHLNPNEAIERLCLKLGVPVRIGYSKDEGAGLTDWLPYRNKQLGAKHEGFLNFELLRCLNLSPPHELKPSLSISICHASSLPRVKEAYFLAHVSAHGTKPRLPSQFASDLMVKIALEFKLQVVLVSSEENASDLVEAQLRASGVDVLNLSGQTSLSELAHLCKKAKIMLTRDSGPAHLAAALGCPTLTFFLSPRRRMGPKRWKPLGEFVDIYTKSFWHFPFETQSRLAKRMIKRFVLKEAYEKAVSLMSKKGEAKDELRFG